MTETRNFPFNLIGPNREKPDVIPDGWLWSEKKHTLYRKPNPPFLSGRERVIALAGVNYGSRDVVADTLGASAKVFLRTGSTVEELHAVIDRAAEQLAKETARRQRKEEGATR